MEYLEAVDDAEFAALLASWIASNRPSARGAWRDAFNSYAVSLRTVVWMQQLAARSGRLSPRFIEEICASLVQQLAFLARNLETDLGGNHLIKNVKALIWGSAFLEGEDPARWRAKGLELLSGALSEQIFADGMHYERSPSYHFQVLADLLECRHALGADPLGGRLDNALARMAQAAADLAHPDGKVALFNDAGLAMAYSPVECLAVYARLFGSAPEPRGVFALTDAGYYGLRSGATYLVADCGAIAPDDLMAHGHGDVLSFEWTIAGKRLIVDQGVFEYVAGERRQQARGATSHNTLCFEGADQGDFFGAFRCGRRPKVEVLAYEPGRERFVLQGTHDGFAHLPGRPRHVRRFEVTPGEIVIDDRIEGRPDRAAVLSFLFHPDCQVSIEDGQARVRRGEVEATLSSTAPLALEPAVWWPDMGAELAAQRLTGILAPGTHLAKTTLRVVSPPARATQDDKAAHV
jgi:uncharacterized heparinase superfamily protein